MSDCWICGRSFEEVTKIVSEMPAELKVDMYKSSEKLYPVCVFCRAIIKYIALEGVNEARRAKSG